MNRQQADSALFSHLAHELLAKGASLRFEAKGRSMWPTIHDGDILHVEPARVEELRVGHIVLFKGDEGLKAHRIVRREGKSFFTRGDAGIENDGKIAAEAVIGKVVSRERGATGEPQPLSGAWDRARFFLRELRRCFSRARAGHKCATSPAAARPCR